MLYKEDADNMKQRDVVTAKKKNMLYYLSRF